MLILISKKPQDLAFASSLSAMLKTELIHPKTFEQEIEILRSEPEAEVIFDSDDELLYLRIEAALLDPRYLVPRFHFLSSRALSACHHALQSPFFLSQVRRSNSMEGLANLYAGLCRLQLGEGVLGIDQSLPMDGEDTVFPIGSNLEKAKVLQELKNHLATADVGERNLSTLVMAADELLMNAIFDAPVDEMGNRVSIAVARTSPIRLQGRRRIALRARFNETHIAIEVRDFFGSLERERLFAKLAAAYGTNDYSIDPRSAGAGLGLASVHRSGGSLLFHCRSGELTSVTALFARVNTAQKLRDAFRFVRCEFH